MAFEPIDGTALSELIGAIYAAGIDPERWDDAIERVRVAVGGTAAVLSTSMTTPAQGGFTHSRQYSAQDLKVHASLPTKHLRLEGWIRRGRPIAAFPGSALVDWTLLRRSAIYNDFFRPRGLHDACLAFVFDGQGGPFPQTTCTVFREAGHDLFRTREAGFLQLLIPHFRRALETNRLFALQARENRVGIGALERIASAVLVVDCCQVVVYANPAARALFDEGALSIHNGRLSAPHSEDAGHLAKLLGRTMAQHPRMGSGGSLMLPVPSRPEPLRLNVVPLAVPHALVPSREAPGALIYASDPAPRSRLGEIARSSRLTPQESRVLGAIVEGKSARQMAEDFRLSWYTVRTHQRAVMAKTGAKRQADLVRMALSTDREEEGESGAALGSFG